jgi:Putative rhamnosyl transferase
MPSMSHYVITRFNVRPSAAETSKALDIDWLLRRFELFDRFCWPSLRQQTQQNFKWLVFFDIDTPELIRQKVNEYARWPNFEPVYLRPGEDNSARAVLARHMTALPDTLITTRLDNDDGLALDYIEQVQGHAHVTEATVVEFPCGYIWHNDRLYRDRQPHNAFTSLIEPLAARSTSSFTTIYCGPHPEVEKLGKVVLVSNEPTWLQVVHGGNLENRPRGVRCTMRELDDRFAVEHATLAKAERLLPFLFDRLRTGLYMGAFNVLRAVKRAFVEAV